MPTPALEVKELNTRVATEKVGDRKIMKKLTEKVEDSNDTKKQLSSSVIVPKIEKPVLKDIQSVAKEEKGLQDKLLTESVKHSITPVPAPRKINSNKVK